MRKDRMKTKEYSAGSTVLTVAFVLICLVWIMPIYEVVVNSLKSNNAINLDVFALPNSESFVGFANYVKGMTFGNYPFLKSVGYSLFISVVSTALILLCCSMAAWYIARVRSGFAKFFYYLCLFSMIVPFQMVMFTLTSTADSLKLSPLQMSVTMRLVKNFNLNFNTTWDPYVYRPDANGSVRKINKFRWNAHQGFMKLSSFSTSFSYTLSNDTFKRKKDADNDRDREPGEDDDEITEEDSFSDMATRKRSRQKSQVVNNSDNDGYEKWQFPWSLTLNYSVSYGYGDYDYKKLDYKGRWMQNLSISGSVRPTPNWNFSFSASYNFELHKLAYMNCSISRDIHCFTMSASFVPVGPYKSYNFHIAVKSSLLKDLKYDQRSQTSNGVQWY